MFSNLTCSAAVATATQTTSFGATPKAVPHARAFVRRCMASWFPAAAHETASLVVTELITSAVLRGGATQVAMRLTRITPDRMAIEVSDNGTAPAMPEHCNGLALLDAFTVGRHVANGAGTCVWALLSVKEEPRRAHEFSAQTAFRHPSLRGAAVE